MAVIGDTDGPIAPCGACRQVMIESGHPRIAGRAGQFEAGRAGHDRRRPSSGARFIWSRGPSDGPLSIDECPYRNIML